MITRVDDIAERGGTRILLPEPRHCRAGVYSSEVKGVVVWGAAGWDLEGRVCGCVIIPAMKIGLNAHLLSGQAGYRSAGIHAYISQLLRHLPAAAPEDWRFEAMVGAGCDADFRRLDLARSRWDTAKPLRRILWEQAVQPARLRRYDLYHAMAFVAPLMLSAPMVTTVYDLSFLRYPRRLSAARRIYLRAMTRISCRRALRILAISRSTADDLSAFLDLPADKIDVTPLGYDKQAYRPLPVDSVERFRARQRLPERFWLYIGTLEPRKNLPTLLRAYAKLPRSERLPLILVGGVGWGADEVFAAIEREDLADSARHIGFAPQADMPLWYNSAEAFLYPSVYEGFGLPVLEAMACGRPIVTTDVSSLPEVAGQAGMCLSPRDEAAWTEALHLIGRDSNWREAAREKSLARAKRFSWERTAALTVGSYRKALRQLKGRVAETRRGAEPSRMRDAKIK